MTSSATSPDRDKYCRGDKRQSEGECTRPAGWGTDHVGFGRCKLHGGSTPSHRKAGRLRAVEADARSVLAREGVSPIGDPLAKIAELAATADAMQKALAARVNALTELRFTDSQGAERVQPELVLWERALDRTERFCVDLGRLGYAEQLVRLATRQTDMLEQIVRGALVAAGLPEPERLRVLAALPAVIDDVVGVPG